MSLVGVEGGGQSRPAVSWVRQALRSLLQLIMPWTPIPGATSVGKRSQKCCIPVLLIHTLTFCCLQSLHARFTPGWCLLLLPLAVDGLAALPPPAEPPRRRSSSSSWAAGPLLLSRFRLRESSRTGDCSDWGLICCGERLVRLPAAEGGSNAVPADQLMAKDKVTFIEGSRDAPVSGGCDFAGELEVGEEGLMTGLAD